MKPLENLVALLAASSAATKRQIAAKAKTSVATLRQYAVGVRGVSAAKAILIEKATKGAVKREQLCKACGSCELAKAARTGEPE